MIEIKSFKLDANHDVEIVNNEIQLTEGAELTRQKAECTLNTKIEEWFVNSDLGIDMNALLGKNIPDDETIKSVILRGLHQIDETFAINDFASEYNKTIRKLTITFTAITESGESITLSQTWG